MDDKIRQLVNQLLSMTLEEKIEWHYSNSENSFKLELDSATLVISYIYADILSGKEDVYYLNMYNGTGKPIELLSLGKEDNPADYGLLSRLYDIAKESTNKKSSTIDKILEELSIKDLPF